MDKEEMSFEESLNKLESIVKKLENGNGNLDESITSKWPLSFDKVKAIISSSMSILSLLFLTISVYLIPYLFFIDSYLKN